MRGGLKTLNAILELSKGVPYPPTLFGIYINKLEECLESAGCKGTNLTRVLIIIILYADDIILLAKIYDELDKKLQILHYYSYKMGMIVNTDKVKVRIIKSKNITPGSFVYNNQCLEKVSSFKYMGIIASRK